MNTTPETTFYTFVARALNKHSCCRILLRPLEAWWWRAVIVTASIGSWKISNSGCLTVNTTTWSHTTYDLCLVWDWEAPSGRNYILYFNDCRADLRPADQLWPVMSISQPFMCSAKLPKQTNVQYIRNLFAICFDGEPRHSGAPVLITSCSHTVPLGIYEAPLIHKKAATDCLIGQSIK